MKGGGHQEGEIDALQGKARKGKGRERESKGKQGKESEDRGTIASAVQCSAVQWNVYSSGLGL